MTTRLGWLTRSLVEVPADDRWLGSRERRVLEGLRPDKRRREWRLGRCTAKAAVAAWLSVPPEQVEILPAPDGAPHAYVEGETAPVAISLSHRADRALAVVADTGCEVGCDLEIVKPRSPAFLNGWLTTEERAVVEAAPQEEHRYLANAMWTAKEAAAKVRRAGVRLDARRTPTTLDGVDGSRSSWRRLSICLDEDAPIAGWWRAEPEWVMAIAAEPSPAEPLSLADAER